jgi:hypothetical protein
LSDREHGYCSDYGLNCAAGLVLDFGSESESDLESEFDFGLDPGGPSLARVHALHHERTPGMRTTS